MRTWSLYLLECADGSLYTGVAINVARRFGKHKRGKAAKYTRGRGPLKLLFQREIGDRGMAQRVEFRVKALNPNNKRRLANDQAYADEFFGLPVMAA